MTSVTTARAGLRRCQPGVISLARIDGRLGSIVRPRYEVGSLGVVDGYIVPQPTLVALARRLLERRGWHHPDRVARSDQERSVEGAAIAT